MFAEPAGGHRVGGDPLRDLFAVVMLFGIYSLLSASLFVVLDAVDVAFTEASVGAGSPPCSCWAHAGADHQSREDPYGAQAAVTAAGGVGHRRGSDLRYPDIPITVIPAIRSIIMWRRAILRIPPRRSVLFPT